MTTPDSVHRLLDMLLAPFRAYCVYAAVQLDLPDRLSKGPVETAVLAHELGVDHDSLRRLLRMLASLAVVEPVGPDNYGIGDLGYPLRTDVPDSMRDLAVCYAEQFYSSFRHVVSSIRHGRPSFPDVFGAPLFEHYASHPEQGVVFDRAMAAGSSFFRAVPNAHDFADARSVVDVGGGDGSLLAEIVANYPHLHGLLAEMPRLINSARQRFEERGVADRCTIAACDMFDKVPEGGDVYILSRVLHDWGDRNCQRLLGTIRAAMRPETRLLVIERVIPANPSSPTFALDFDLHMLVNTGGRERDQTEYDVLFAASGLRRSDIAELPLGVHVVTAVPT